MSSDTTTTAKTSSSAIPLPEMTKLSAHTKSATAKIQFNWTIDNISFYFDADPKDFSPIISPEFSPPGHEDVRFCLWLYPNNHKKEDADHVSLYLHCFQLPSPIYVRYTMSFIDREGCDQHLRYCQCKFTENNGNGYAKMLPRSLLLNPANGLLPNDQLTVSCVANICFIFKVQSNLSRLSISDQYEKQFSANMISLLENAKHSDVMLTVDGTELPAHKSILSVRSPVFDAMFSHENTKEVREGNVVIDDVSADVFQDLLQFIYTGKFPAKERLTTELLVASDKYQVEGLKSACESHLSTSLSIESAATTLLYADMHNATSLKVNCIKYIAGNIFAVMSTEAWINMAKVRPELMQEISNLSFVAQEESNSQTALQTSKSQAGFAYGVSWPTTASKSDHSTKVHKSKTKRPPKTLW